jgi:predicted Zn-ribbon and HTH transcriptional regulator
VHYVSTHEKVTIGCRLPGHGTFRQTPANHLQKQRCPKCKGERIANSKASKSQDFIAKARVIHGDRYDYAGVCYTRNVHKVDIGCRDHGVFAQTAMDHLAGSKCPECANEEKSEKLSLTPDEFLQRAKEMHGDRYDYSLARYVSAHSKVQIVCPKHGVFEQTPNNHIRGNECPGCFNNYSKGHREVEAFLDSCGIAYESNTRSVIDPLELDIYIPTHHLAIEFNGSYWHSVDGIDPREKRKKHLVKFERCREIGISLLQVDQHEWGDHHNGIWRSIIASKLGIHARIPARKTEFRVIGTACALNFFEENHLQGAPVGAPCAFGIYFAEELVGAVAFTKYQGGVLNLTRLAFKQGVTIVGGAQKLFKNALVLLPARDIVTFSHNRYSMGNIYSTLGFSKDGDLPPSYQWLYKGQVWNKRRLRHKYLPGVLGSAYDPTLTEHQNMYRAGARCMYDAGYQRWVYRRLQS